MEGNTRHPVCRERASGASRSEHLLRAPPPPQLDGLWPQRGGDCVRPQRHAAGALASPRGASRWVSPAPLARVAQ